MSKPKNPRGDNHRSKNADELSIVNATEENTNIGKDPAAVALGRKGGLKGGKARAKSLTPDQRSEIAKKAAKVRWQKAKSLLSDNLENKQRGVIQTPKE